MNLKCSFEQPRKAENNFLWFETNKSRPINKLKKLTHDSNSRTFRCCLSDHFKFMNRQEHFPNSNERKTTKHFRLIFVRQSRFDSMAITSTSFTSSPFFHLFFFKFFFWKIIISIRYFSHCPTEKFIENE